MEDKKLDALSREKKIETINKEIEKLEKIQHETKDVYTFVAIGKRICHHEESLLDMKYDAIYTRLEGYIDMLAKEAAKFK